MNNEDDWFWGTRNCAAQRTRVKYDNRIQGGRYMGDMEASEVTINRQGILLQAQLTIVIARKCTCAPKGAPYLVIARR